QDAACGVGALGESIIPMIDTPGSAGVLVDGDASCGVGLRVLPAAQTGVDMDRSAPWGGAERQGAQGGDDEVCGEVAAVIEDGVQAAVRTFQGGQCVPEVGVHRVVMGAGELLGDLAAEDGDPRELCRSGEGDLASSMIEDPG